MSYQEADWWGKVRGTECELQVPYQVMRVGAGTRDNQEVEGTQNCLRGGGEGNTSLLI